VPRDSLGGLKAIDWTRAKEIAMKRSQWMKVFALSLVPTMAVQAEATLTQIRGDVQVNQGSEFVAASEAMTLQPGDRVLTATDGSAHITFDDGCDLDAAPNTLITLPETSTCAGGALLAQNVAPTEAGAVGAGSASGGFPWRTTLLILLPTAAAAYAIIDNNNNNQPTVSP